MAEDSDVRIGTADRERAQQSLGEHFAAGRLETEEFEERPGSIASARTSHELARVFDDLPADPNQVGAGTAAPVRRQPAAEPERRKDGGLDGWVGAAVASVSILAVIAFFVISGVFHVGGAWVVFLAIPLVGAIAKGYRGDR